VTNNKPEINNPEINNPEINKPETMNNTLFDKIFRDRSGNIVLGQLPNLTIILWLATTLLKLVFNSGKVGSLLDILSFGFLFTWAWEELTEGVNYFRRGLGAVVLLAMIVTKVSSSIGT